MRNNNFANLRRTDMVRKWLAGIWLRDPAAETSLAMITSDQRKLTCGWFARMLAHVY
jgi:hypothetical protein